MMKPKNDMKLGELLDAIYSKGRVGDKLIEKKIKSFWYSEMGASIVSRTNTVAYRNGSIFISVSSAPLRQQLIIEKETIKKRIKDAVPKAKIEQVRIQ